MAEVAWRGGGALDVRAVSSAAVTLKIGGWFLAEMRVVVGCVRGVPTSCCGCCSAIGWSLG